MASICPGLWAFPFETLVIRSGFIPRVLGVLLLIAGVGYLATYTPGNGWEGRAGGGTAKSE